MNVWNDIYLQKEKGFSMRSPHVLIWQRCMLTGRNEMWAKHKKYKNKNKFSFPTSFGELYILSSIGEERGIQKAKRKRKNGD